MIHRAMVIAMLGWSSNALALDVGYHSAIELKPLATFDNPLRGGRGLGVGIELGSIANTFITSCIERSSASFVMIGRDQEVESTSVGLGLRHYSYHRTDSLYFGADARRVHVDFTQYLGSTPWASREFNRVRADIGYRWIWATGMFVRAGAGLLRDFDFRTEESSGEGGLTVQQRKESPDKITRNVRDHAGQWSPTVDLGVGVAF